MSRNKSVYGFKRFSDMKNNFDKNKSLKFDEYISDKANLPEKSSKTEQIMPDNKDGYIESDSNLSENKIETIGKVARFKNNVKASNAYNILEDVKVSKKSIWYIMIEKQENELQMIKYNYKEGVNLGKFINELKSYYISKYKSNSEVCNLVNNIEVDGNDNYSMVKNIPFIELEGKKMISKITEDLIHLLSK